MCGGEKVSVCGGKKIDACVGGENAVSRMKSFALFDPKFGFFTTVEIENS